MVTERDMLTSLAIGLLRQQQAPQPVILLDPYIRQGWETLCSMCFRTGILPPGTLPELVKWLHTPVEQWSTIGESIQSMGITGYLLQDGFPAGLAYQLGEPFANTYNPRLEMEDARFRQIFALCQRQGETEQYSLTREFLNRNPLLTDIYESVVSDSKWKDGVRPLLTQCYEPVPVNCVRKVAGKPVIFRCPHCGWALSWRHDHAFCHADGPCTEFYGDLSTAGEFIPYEPDTLWRTIEGVQRYVVAPEVTLIRLYDSLSHKWGIRCDLYPELDTYDLLVHLPNGQKWAVDVKDWKSPESIALNIGVFPFIPEWDKAFYVFPDYRTQKAGYLTAFKNYWLPQKDVMPVSYSEFIKRVGTEIG